MTITRDLNHPTKRWLVLIILSLPVFIGSIDLTIISAILPEVINQLHLPIDSKFDDASWAISGYLLAYTLSMTFMGRISDMFGRRTVYIVCLIIFMFGSWFVAIAHTWPAEWYLDVYRWIYPNPDTHIPPPLEMRQLYMIIAGRVIQACGAGAIVPATMAVVSDMFPAEHRAKPLGFVGAIDTAGWVLGHLYGGLMVKAFGVYGHDIQNFFSNLGLSIGELDWRTLFWLNIPFGIVSLIGAWWALHGPEFRHHYGGKFDYLGTALIMLALTALSIGLGGASPESAFGASSFEEISEKSATSNTVPLLIAALTAFLLFILWELRTKTPLIDLRLFRKRNYSASSFINFCVGFCLALGLVSVPLLINLRADSTARSSFQDAALTAGLVLSGLTVPMAIAAIPGGALTERYGFRKVTCLGLAMSAIGFLICSLTWTSTISTWAMSIEMAIIGVGLGLTISPVTTALINDVKDTERGVSAALVLILRLVGMTLAISGMTSYALLRIEHRIGQLGNIADLEARQEAYLNATVSQMNELFLIGAIVSLAALLAATRLHSGRLSDTQLADKPIDANF